MGMVSVEKNTAAGPTEPVSLNPAHSSARGGCAMARSTPFSLILLLALASPVLAQDPVPPTTKAFRLSWIEFGGGFTPVIFLGEGMALTGTVQARVNLFSALAVELSTHSPGSEGFYDIHMRVNGKSAGPASGFFTMGGLGAFETRRVPEFRNTLPTGDVIVYPAHRYSRITKPWAMTLGGGARVRLHERVAVEVGGEAWWAGGVAFAMRTALMVGIGPRR
jgi:hypothetical protein